MKKCIIKDRQDRTLVLMGSNGKLVIARYPDLDEQLKNYIIDFYRESSEEGEKGVEKLRKFLNYESDENEFCG